jgi:hypothetical protein
MGLGAFCLLTVAAQAGDDMQRITVTSSQTEFLRNEPILIGLRVEGGTATNLPAAPDGEGAATGLRFEVEPKVNLRKGAKPLPGEARVAASPSRTYDLLEWFEFPESGTFTVRAVYESGSTRLTSAPVRVTIQNPKIGDAEFDAVARIHHVPWSNYETNAYCGDTADVVKRWPASKLARYCQYWNGRYAQHQKDYAKAIASYEEVIANYPGCLLAEDARRGLEECRKGLK